MHELETLQINNMPVTLVLYIDEFLLGEIDGVPPQLHRGSEKAVYRRCEDTA
jgi:hypothetical protein